MVAHADGTIILYDREREDPVSSFTPRDPTAGPSVPFFGPGAEVSPSPSSLPTPGVLSPEIGHNGNPSQGFNNQIPNSGSASGDSVHEPYEWNPLEEMIVTPGPSGSFGPTGAANPAAQPKDKVLRNPVTHWKVSKKPIHGTRVFLTLDFGV